MQQVVRSAVLAFLVTRAIFFALTIFGSQLAFERKVYSGSVWETRVVLSSQRLLPELTRVSMTGDAWFYFSIAADGYTRNAGPDGEGANWAFFPLYPLLVRLLGFGAEFALAGMAISNAAFLGALILAGVIARATGGAAEDADRAIWYLAAFPTSYFCSLPLPEGLFLLLTTASFAAAALKKWPLAGLFAALASATRFAGILLIPALVLLAIERRERLRGWAPWLLLAPVGTLAFMAHLYQVTGNPIAFVTVQQRWGRAASAAWTPLVAAIANLPTVSLPWNLVAFNLAVAIVLTIAGAVFLAKKQWSFAAYTLGSLLLPLSSGSLQSLGRYAAVVFPLFILLGHAGRRFDLDRAILACSLALYGWFIALFILRVDFALA